MVVAAGDFQLGMVLVALAAQLFRRGKIEGGSCHRKNPAGRKHFFINLQYVVAVNG